MIGWQFLKIGYKIEGRKIENINQILKSAQYCEKCYRFIGRWMSWGR